MKRSKGSSTNSRVKYSIARESCPLEKGMGKNTLLARIVPITRALPSLLWSEWYMCHTLPSIVQYSAIRNQPSSLHCELEL